MGYQNISLTGGAQDILSSAFVAVGDGEFDIQNIVIPEDKITDGVDSIMIFTPGSGYKTYNYYEMTIDDPDAEEVQEYGPGWGEDNVRAIGVTLSKGQGCWLKTGKTAALTFSGQVNDSDFEQFDMVGGAQNIKASPYAVATDIQMIEIPENKITDGVDSIMIFTPGSGYKTYNYYEMTIDDPDAEEVQEYGPGWGEDNVRAIGVKLRMGQGCWLKTGKTASLTVYNPTKVVD